MARGFLHTRNLYHMVKVYMFEATINSVLDMKRCLVVYLPEFAALSSNGLIPYMLYFSLFAEFYNAPVDNDKDYLYFREGQSLLDAPQSEGKG